MNLLDKKRIDTLFNEFQKQRVIVVGDLMLDSYLWGTVSRISPEAPVPIVEVAEKSDNRFGGAANVTFNITSLGAEVIPVGVVGDDRDGTILRELFSSAGFSTEGLFVDPDRPTTVKTRVIAHEQQVVRIDREIKTDISPRMQETILKYTSEQLKHADAIILEDYNKGLLSAELIKEIIQSARKHGVNILVDPKFNNFFNYEHVTIFKPNRKEASERLGMRIESEQDARAAGGKLLERLKCDAVLITLGEQGMALFEKNGSSALIPTKAQEVHDVSGAGDTVISTIAIAMGAGATLLEAAVIANQAAGIVCGTVGIVPVNREVLQATLIKEISL